MLSHPYSLLPIHFVQVCKGNGEGEIQERDTFQFCSLPGRKRGRREVCASDVFIYGSATLLFAKIVKEEMTNGRHQLSVAV